MREVDIDVLKEHYPEEYQSEYERWANGQSDVVDAVLHEVAPMYADEQLEGTGWRYPCGIQWEASCSQSDGVSISSAVYFNEMNEATLDELRKDFPMCVALLKREYLHVWSDHSSRSVCSIVNWRFDDIQENEDDEEWDGEVSRLSGGLYDGLPESVAFQVAHAEGFYRFVDDLGDRLKDAESKVYHTILDEIEHQYSEETFIEWARDTGETFEVEDEEAVS